MFWAIPLDDVVLGVLRKVKHSLNAIAVKDNYA